MENSDVFYTQFLVIKTTLAVSFKYWYCVKQHLLVLKQSRHVSALWLHLVPHFILIQHRDDHRAGMSKCTPAGVCMLRRGRNRCQSLKYYSSPVLASALPDWKHFCGAPLSGVCRVQKFLRSIKVFDSWYLAELQNRNNIFLHK